MSGLSYSAGYDQACWHDENGRHDFPKGQLLYGGDWELVVTDLAEDYHANHDGWESTWPLQIRIYEGSVELARFLVEREHEPTFLAYELKAEKPA